MSISISSLVQSVGSDVLSPWAVPARDREVTDLVFYEATEPFAAGPGDLVLAVGLTTDQVAELLDLAGAGGVVGVVCRATVAVRERLGARADRAGTALLVLGSGTGWAGLTSQLRGLLTTSGSRPAEELPVSTRQDLVAVANTLASAVGGSVLVFNPQQDLLAASRMDPDADDVRHRAVFDQHGPSEYRTRLRELGVYDELWHREEAVEVQAIPDLGASRRLAIAVRAGEEVLGSIWVAEGAQPLADDARSVLGHAARLVRQQLVARYRGPQSERQFAEDLTRQLLAGDVDASAVAAWLELDPHRPCRVVAVACPDDSPASGRRLADQLLLHFSAYRQRVLPVVSRGRIHLVVGDPAAGAPDERSARESVTRAAEALRLDVHAVVGPAVPVLARVAESRDAADRGLRILARSQDAEEPGGTVCDIADVLPAVQALHVAELVAVEVDRAGAVPVLQAHDADHGTALAGTLEAWLDAFGDVAAAARRLHVHPNTVRYRLGKAVEVSGLDLSDPDERLMATLLLRASVLSGPPTPAATGWRTAQPQGRRT